MKKKSLFSNVKNLTLIAMLIAMSIVISIFCKSVMNFSGGLLRITFENLPIILSGIIFGPVAGGLVGLSADLIGYFLSGQAFPLNIIVTVGSVTVGILSGVVSKYIIRKRGVGQIISAGCVSHIVGSMIIKTIGLFQFYGWAVLIRIPLYMVIGGLEILILCLLYKKSGFRRLIEGVDMMNEKRTEDKNDKSKEGEL